MNLRDERGLVGKLAVVWLLILALLGVALYDTVSIVSTRLHLSNIATKAASDAESAWQSNHDLQATCAVAATTVKAQDPATKITKQGCTVDPQTGTVTIKVRKAASTLLAGRLSFTKKYANVTDTEADGPAAV